MAHELPADASPDLTLDLKAASSVPSPTPHLRTYTPEKQQQQRDWVRMVLTIAVLLLFGWVIVWASLASTLWPGTWDKTKEMLQIALPAVTGLLGSVTGFYFGSENRSGRPVDPVTGK